MRDDAILEKARMIFIDHFMYSVYTLLSFTQQPQQICIESRLLWMSVPKTVKHENDMGIIGNDMRIN